MDRVKATLEIFRGRSGERYKELRLEAAGETITTDHGKASVHPRDAAPCTVAAATVAGDLFLAGAQSDRDVAADEKADAARAPTSPLLHVDHIEIPAQFIGHYCKPAPRGR